MCIRDRFIVAEKSAPFEIGVFELEPFWADMGRKKAEAARRIYRECMKSGTWPGYDTAPQTLMAPSWAVIEHEMQYENGEIHA